MSARTAPLTVVCYVRPGPLVESIDAHIETLQRCAAEEGIDIETLVVRTWPAECSVARSSSSHQALAAFERFRAWADRAGVSICPPFEQGTRTSTITGEHQELLRTPLLCLAFYVDDQLAAVYPHTDGGHTYSVADVIARLHTGELPARVVATSPPASTPIGTCPECGAPCHTGQGVYVCFDCRWVAGTTGNGHYQTIPALRSP